MVLMTMRNYKHQAIYAINSKTNIMTQVIIQDKNPKPIEIRQGPLCEIFTDLFAKPMKT